MALGAKLTPTALTAARTGAMLMRDGAMLAPTAPTLIPVAEVWKMQGA